MRSRQEAIEQIRHEQQLWRDIVAQVGRDRMNEPGPMGEWTFKDLVSHLAAWRGRTVARLDAVARGQPEPAAPWPTDLSGDDPINDWIRARDRSRSLDDLLATYDRSFDQLADALGRLPDEALNTPKRFSWMGDGAIVDADFAGHLHQEHETAIRAWLAARDSSTAR